MPVQKNNKKLIPAPLLRLEKEVERNATGGVKRSLWIITMNGTLLPDKGSPDSTGTFWTASDYPPDETIAVNARLASFRAKQGALCHLLGQDRQWLEWQPLNGSIASKCQPRLRSLTFQEGVWVSRCDYQAVFEANSIWFGTVECPAGNGGEDPCDESWDIEQADDASRTYRLVHTVAATFRDSYNSDGTINQYGWERAKEAVEARLGLDNDKLIQSGVLNLGDFGAYNHARSISESPSEGSYRVTETWLCFDVEDGPAAIEDYTVVMRNQAERSTVTIEGTITGLHVRDGDFAITTTKYENAVEKWETVSSLLLSRAQTASGLTLNPQSLSLQVSRNEFTGIITYSCEFDDRFTYGDAISLEITLQDQYAADVFAAIPVVGRPAGPVLQNIGSTTETARTVTIDAQFPPLGYSGTAVRPDLTALALLYQPSATQIFVARHEEQWQVVNNRIQKTITWVYQ